MKKSGLGILFFFAMLQLAAAQWIPQTSGVSNNLRDIAFYNAGTGYAVGEGGVVLKTNNGGKQWVKATSPTSSDLVSLTLLDSAALLVTSAAVDGAGTVFESVNGGKSWFKVLSDAATFYAAAAPGKALYSVSTKLYNSQDFGKSWQVLQSLNPTTVYQQLLFSDSKTGIIAGNIAGMVTYSTAFLRTIDGSSWYSADPFSFPNANGFSCLDAIAADSVLMFTNFYNRFEQGDSSQLVLLHHFNLKKAFGSRSWFFNSRVLVNSFPDVMTDCKFFRSGNGFAVSKNGNIYSVAAGGKNIYKEYSSQLPLRALYMLDSNTGFAVGDKGLIVKRTPQMGTAGKVIARGKLPMQVYPNPATDRVTIAFTLTEAATLRLQITGEGGNVVLAQSARYYDKGSHTIALIVANFSRGHYRVSFMDGEGKVVGSSQMMVAR